MVMKSFSSDRKSPRRDSSRFNREDRPDRFERREAPRFIREDRPERRSSERFERRGSARPGFNKEMHEVTCDKCGNKCEVPFRPTAGKPVYCSDCFRKNEHTDSRRSESSAAPAVDTIKIEMNIINSKLDRILSLLEDKD